MIPNTNNFNIIRRNTKARNLVLGAVCDGGHPSAREIFERISTANHVSFGTVYRNLQILEEEGEIISVTTDPYVLHYDRRRDRHHHICCKKCGKVFDIDVPYRPDIDTEAEYVSGFAIESHTIAFEGVCSMCKSP